MSKIAYLRNCLLGDRDKIMSERYFVTLFALTGVAICVVRTIFHLIGHLSVRAALLTSGMAVFFLVIWCLVRYYQFLLVPKFILSFGGILLIDFAWYFQDLSNGPVLLVLLIFTAHVIWVWEGRQLLYIMVFYYINLIVLFIVDYNATHIEVSYPDNKTRTLHMFISFFLYCVLLIFILYSVKKEFLRQQKKAVHSDKLKSAFLANMSHEIRTPMNGILGFSDLLRNPNLNGETQQEYIKIIERSGHRMLGVINDIIDISKIEAGLVKLDIRESNIREQLEYVRKFFTPEVAAKGMTLYYENETILEDVVIKTDREKVFAILINLVKNAIKYSKNGTIKFGYKIKGNFIEFHVADTGIGIATDRRQVIFERFIQADIENLEAIQGAGLGLSITKSYVELLGGKIWLESELGRGSIFYFTLPYVPINNKNQMKDIDKIVAIDELERLNLNILIVEDDEISEALMCININDFCKNPLIARTGLEAIKLCRDNPDLDLILMDMQLPLCNGYDATKQIREFNKEVVIISQTAYGLSRDRERAIAAGCNDYISKPIKNKELVKVIVKHLNKI